MGINISKPFIYLGNKKINLTNILKGKKYNIKDKIGSEKIHLEEHKTVFDMSLIVAKKAINSLKKKPDFLIFVSQTQEKIIPSYAEQIGQKIGMINNSFIFTISSGCSGFVQAIYLAEKLLSKNTPIGLIVCAEKYSNVISKENLKTRLLFSDAATATIVKYKNKKNILETSFGFDGTNSHALQVNKVKNKDILNMDGNKLLMFTMRNIPNVINKIIKKHNNIKIYLIHPGSKILLDTLTNKINISSKKVPNTFNLTANTVSSSIPLLINKNYNSFRFGNKILMSGFGVGLSHATILVKWA